MRPPATYIAAAARLRRYAERIAAAAAARTPQERRALTLAIHGLSRYAQALSQRHRGP